MIAKERVVCGCKYRNALSLASSYTDYAILGAPDEQRSLFGLNRHWSQQYFNWGTRAVVHVLYRRGS